MDNNRANCEGKNRLQRPRNCINAIMKNHKDLREIRFRVWLKDKDIPQGYMCNGTDNMFISTHRGELAIENFEGKINHYNKEQYIVMRYTGKKDKAKKNIYEDDIVENFNGIRGVVYFFDGAFLIVWENDFTGYPFITGTETIIGNIYENKELLNA